MIKALDSATMGLLKAQKRASELATDILKTTTSQQPEAATGRQNTSRNAVGASIDDSGSALTGIQPHSTAQTNSLIQQISEFKLAEIQFRASATAFSRIADTSEVSLGLLVDKKS